MAAPAAAAPGVSGRRRSASRHATAAGAPAVCPVLARFEVAWAELRAELPAHSRVRMEGLDPSALPLSRAAWLAVGYPWKWATASYACPPEVAAHFARHSAAMTALSRAQAAPRAASPADKPPTLRLGLVGDCMWMRDSWPSFMSARARAALESCDALIGNLETPLHARRPRNPLWLLQSLLPDMVTYSSPVAFLDAFKRQALRPKETPLMGAFTTANNHSADMGAAGARATVEALDAAGIPHCGMRVDGSTTTWCSFERTAARGTAPTLRVGVYAATFGVNFPDKAAQCVAAGVAIQTLPGLAAASATGAGEVDLREAVAALADMAAAGCGLRVVAMHWGHEFEGFPTVPQMAVARALVRAGADVIVGAHAHVTQPAEILLVNGYEESEACSAAERQALAQLPAASRLAGVAGPPRKALVLYCLGNFCTTMFNELCRVGTLLTLQVSPPASPDAPWSWRLPTWHWMYNEARVLLRLPGAAPRRLLYLARDGDGLDGGLDGADDCDGLPCDDAQLLAPRKRRLLDFTRHHVLGGDDQPRALPRMRF